LAIPLTDTIFELRNSKLENHFFSQCMNHKQVCDVELT
jgi:hypothetical protein